MLCSARKFTFSVTHQASKHFMFTRDVIREKIEVSSSVLIEFSANHQTVTSERDTVDSSPSAPQPPTVQLKYTHIDTATANHFEGRPEASISGPEIVVHHADVETSTQPSADSDASSLLSGVDNPGSLEAIDDWWPASQIGPEQGQSSDSTTRSGSPVDGLFMPETTDYTLRITFENENVPVAASRDPLHLNENSSYRQIEQIAEDCVKEHCKSSLAGKSLNFRNGECAIIRGRNHKHVHGLSSEEDWKDICTIVKNFFTSNSHLHQQLDITRDYFGLLERRIRDETFASSKQSEIHVLMKEASGLKEYIPRTDLLRVTSTDMVRQILLEDPIPEQQQSAQDAFIGEVLDRGRVLLAACVYTDLRMQCLKVLMDKGHNDNTLPRTPLATKHCCHHDCGSRFKQLLSAQGGFYAAEFWEIGEHKRLHSCTVVPMQYHSQERQEGDCRNEETETPSEVEETDHDEKLITPAQKACCGSGAYSNVFRVRLDPAHHRLSKVSHALLVYRMTKVLQGQECLLRSQDLQGSAVADRSRLQQRASYA